MSTGDQIGVDHIDREADWPHIFNKQTRFCNVALRVTNMRWGRRRWDCSKRSDDRQPPCTSLPGTYSPDGSHGSSRSGAAPRPSANGTPVPASVQVALYETLPSGLCTGENGAHRYEQNRKRN